MAIFLIEVHVADAGAFELELAIGMLAAAQTRLSRSESELRTILSGFSREDGRLISLVDAPSLDVARRLVSLALLPLGRIRELTPVANRALLDAGHPGSDGDPRLEAELVEDVVDVSLDGPLGQE